MLRDDPGMQKELAAYFDKVMLVTRGELFSAERWRAIWELNVTSSRRYRSAYKMGVPPFPPEFGQRHAPLSTQLGEWFSGAGR